jgi:glycosyltransferase involved in cell wall biosynthesis
MNMNPNISVVVPLFNEAESLPELYAWIKRVMDTNKFTYEIIFVNDGSTDESWQVIEQLSEKDSNVHGIKFRRNYGKSPALFCGFNAAQGDVVITMDADLQDSPDEIPELYRMITEDGYDLVSGYKQKRYDPLSKTIPTKLFNATARKVSGIKNLHDFNCGLKAYKKAVVKNIEVYGEMHRYIPYLAKNAGFSKIGEKVVQHQARKFGKTKFGGLNRFVNGYLDLLSLWFLNSFGLKPMHVFGFLGTLMFLFGFIAVIIVGAIKLVAICNHTPAPLVTDSPYFHISLAMMIIGTQLFLTGFIAELISRTSQERNKYNIAKEV